MDITFCANRYIQISNFCLLILLIFFSSCGGEKNNETIQSEKKIFKYNQASALYSLDPAFAKDQASIWVAKQIFNTLVEVNEHLEIVPALAKSWEVSEDAKSIKFNLRNDVYFQKNDIDGGALLKASDIVYSFNRLIDPELASPGAWVFNDRVDEEQPFVALDDFTFQINLKEPFQPILGILSMQYCSVVSQKCVEHFGKDFRKYPIGSGAFKLKVWKEGEALILEKNENYWEKDEKGNVLPYLDGIRISFSENKRAAFLDFTEGKTDFLSGIDASYVEEVLTEEGTLKDEWKNKIEMTKTPYLNTEYLGFLFNDKGADILKDKRVRQALNYGIDRESMVKYLRNNIGKAAINGFIPPGLPGYNPNRKGYTYKPDLAKKLLKEAGYETNKKMNQLSLQTTASYQDLCVFIQKQLNEIGFNIELELVPPSFLREKMSKGDAQFFRASWIADYPDSETFLTVFYGGNPAPPNYTQFKNQKYDELYVKAMKTSDLGRRLNLYAQMDEILIEEAPVMPLFYDEVVRFNQIGISGMKINAFNLLDLKTVQLP